MVWILKITRCTSKTLIPVMAGVPDAKKELEAAALAASEKPAENAESEEEIDTMKEEGTAENANEEELDTLTEEGIAEEEKDPIPESPKY